MDYYNGYEDVYSNLLSVVIVFGVILLVVFIAFIIGIVASWKIYRKAGKGGWECIVPFYGYWVLNEIAGLEWWWFLLVISNSLAKFLGNEILYETSNLVSLFASFNIYYNIAIKFNKSKGISVLAGIFPIVFIYIFGFSKKEVYDNSIPVSKNGIFGSPVVNTKNSNTYSSENMYSNSVPHNYSFCGNCGTKLESDAKFCPNCGSENK